MEQHVGHADIRSFAEDKVDLRSDHVSKYRDQANNLRDELARHIADTPGFGLVKMLHAGSVAKGTALSNINDLDVAVYVKKEEAPVAEQDLVDWTRDLLVEAYPTKDPGDIESCRRCVRIHFRTSGLDVDVVPIIHEGGDDDYGHLVDKQDGGIVRTNVKLHLEFIRKRKAASPHFAPVVRLAKWWARQQKDQDPEFKCKSFLIELLVARMADSGADLGDYEAALEEFFNWTVRTGLETRVAFEDYSPAGGRPRSGNAIEVLDPVNPDNNVARLYSEADRDALVRASQDASDAIREARYSTTKGRAVERWQAVLGPSFRG